MYHRNKVVDWMQSIGCSSGWTSIPTPYCFVRDAVDVFGVHPEVAVWDDLLGAATRLMLLRRAGKKVQ